MQIALTIAGSDSGGGAGIQADLRTFHQFGVHGTSVVTAVTAQNTLGVRAVHQVPLDVVEAQAAALAEDLTPAAVKSGMLASAAMAALVAALLDRHAWRPYVLDPVMVATSGDRLLDPGAEDAIREQLLPRAAVVTPNLDEAALLAGFPVRDVGDMARAGERLLAQGAAAALVKGGHLAGAEVTDLLVTPAGVSEWRRPRLRTRSTHGTGCTLSAALAAGLALGRPLAEAVGDALDYVHRAIAAAPGRGAGHGPLAHGVAVRGER